MIGEAVTSTASARPSAAPTGVWSAIGWLTVIGGGGLWALYRLGYSGAWPVVVLQSALPILLVPSGAVVALALVTRRRVLAGAAAIVAMASLTVIVPLVVPRSRPGWVAHAPTLRVLEANLYYDNGRKPEAVRRLLAADADVLVLAEVNRSWLVAFADGGLDDRYPFQITRPSERGGFGSAILSKVRPDQTAVGSASGRPMLSAALTVGSRRVEIVAVHTQSPSLPVDLDHWRRDIAAADARRDDASDGSRVMLVGDFNATYWHAPFRRLLTGGWHDAHQTLGQGMDASWPNLGALGAVLGPFTRLDHAVTSPGVVATKVSELGIPGSDHRGFVVTVALGP